MVFKDAVIGIFGIAVRSEPYNRRSSYVEDRKARTVRFELNQSYSDATYEKLEALSRVLGTTKINIRGRYEEGCPTCGGDNFLNIHCWEVVFPDKPKTKEE